ncbi:hypothetical protein [Aneurinibacillus tyrosinisolvens]|uniref:hypothetical protein n=1 Tax=Aneurinibacillus tyrosinisolvens TaxID=1443435 RepID=UPI00063F3B13|nr:hypothetical protein [Aneurinibacillus tyrosinisolvens]
MYQFVMRKIENIQEERVVQKVGKEVHMKEVYESSTGSFSISLKLNPGEKKLSQDGPIMSLNDGFVPTAEEVLLLLMSNIESFAKMYDGAAFEFPIFSSLSPQRQTIFSFEDILDLYEKTLFRRQEEHLATLDKKREEVDVFIGSVPLKSQKKYNYILNRYLGFWFLFSPDSFVATWTVESITEQLASYCSFMKTYGEQEKGQVLTDETLQKHVSMISAYAQAIGLFVDRKKLPIIRPKRNTTKEKKEKELQSEREKLWNQVEDWRQRVANEPPQEGLFVPTIAGWYRSAFRNALIFELLLLFPDQLPAILNLSETDVHKRGGDIYISLKKANGSISQKRVPETIGNAIREYLNFRRRYDKRIEITRHIYRFENMRMDPVYLRDYVVPLFLEDYEDELEELKEIYARLEKSPNQKDISRRVELEKKAIVLWQTNTFNRNQSLFISNRNQRLSESRLFEIFREMKIRTRQLKIRKKKMERGNVKKGVMK